jgi:hypothetical protein
MNNSNGKSAISAEERRLLEDARREQNWKKWGPYLAERQWGTVREDYSADGSCWEYFPHDHARSRAYRWGEDGLLGITDREGRMCFALTLWNGRDPILKERLFGLTGPEGNHGEDVKEVYYYLDSTPTHSYMKALYRYPHAAYPYARLVEENRSRGKEQPEFELVDTGVFDESRFFDVFAEYAKLSPEDILIRITIANRSPQQARIHLLPTLWFRNTWSWGREGEGYWPKPQIELAGAGELKAHHQSLGDYRLVLERGAEILFTENETNAQRLFGAPTPSPYVKDAFHEYLIHDRKNAVNPQGSGTKAAVHYIFDVPARGEREVRLRLFSADSAPTEPLGPDFEHIFSNRQKEADEFYAGRIPRGLDDDERNVMRQAYAGLLWSKQFFYFSVKDWLEGDPAQPTPPESRSMGRNNE